MKQRILTNWSFTRALYLVLGLIIAIEAFINGQWLGIVLGGYMTSMGVFAFGCASGSCYSKNTFRKLPTASKEDLQNVEYEEIN